MNLKGKKNSTRSKSVCVKKEATNSGGYNHSDNEDAHNYVPRAKIGFTCDHEVRALREEYQ